MYQRAWNPRNKSLTGSQPERVQELIARRLLVWRSIQQWVSSIPQRNGLILLGDFNSTLRPHPPNIGEGVTNHQQSPRQDSEELQCIVCGNGLVTQPIRGADREIRPSTFRRDHSFGAHLDYIITRLPCMPETLKARAHRTPHGTATCSGAMSHPNTTLSTHPIPCWQAHCLHCQDPVGCCTA